MLSGINPRDFGFVQENGWWAKKAPETLSASEFSTFAKIARREALFVIAQASAMQGILLQTIYLDRVVRFKVGGV